jgi:transposase-like protein
MSKVLTKVTCPHCDSANVKKNGIKYTGKQNFYCKSCYRQFQQIYKYQGANPILKKQVCEMSMQASGIRDIAKVLKMSAVTVIIILRLWFKFHQEPAFEGVFEEVIIDYASQTKCGVG